MGVQEIMPFMWIKSLIILMGRLVLEVQQERITFLEEWYFGSLLLIIYFLSK